MESGFFGVAVLVSTGFRGFEVHDGERSTHIEQTISRTSKACGVMNAEFDGVNGGDVGFDPVAETAVQSQQRSRQG